MSDTQVICLVPVKNEAWILRDFIKCAKAWADIIIIGDHNSTDNSAGIAQEYGKVKVVSLHNTSFDRGLRRKILLDEARKIPGKRLIFSIDADEMISANWADSPTWSLMLNAQPGTRFRFDWVEPFPGLRQADVYEQVAAFIDDGTEYIGTMKHEPRIPSSRGEIVHVADIKLLHYIFIEPERMFSKHRWNKCVEIIELGKRPWPMCIMYQDTKIKSYDAPIVSVKEEWLRGYEWLEEYRSGKDQIEKCYWYDEEVLNFFDKYGVGRFRKLNIWDVDWNKKAQLLGRNGNYNDPRSTYEVWVHKFIEQHREELKIKSNFKWKAVRLFGKTALRALGW